jgi:hypothetical protein
MNQVSEFCCYLDGQPDHLTPEHQLGNYWAEDMAGHPLFLNRNCQLAGSSRLPSELADDRLLVEGFSCMEDVLWVRHPLTAALQPFWLAPQSQSVLAETKAGRPVSSFTSYEQRALAMAGELQSQDDGKIPIKRTTDTFSRCADQVRQRGFAPVAGLIHPFHISALRRYFRSLIRTGKLTLGDSQSSRRYHAHNESVARFFHFQLTHAISMIVGQAVKPSYVYFASYQEGATLEKHTDRAQCQFSITLCLDYSPEPKRQTPWPIQLHTPKGVTTVYQSIGDALIYLGCELPHSRGVLPRGHTSSSIFFHYVPVDFDGHLD